MKKEGKNLLVVLLVMVFIIRNPIIVNASDSKKTENESFYSMEHTDEELLKILNIYHSVGSGYGSLSSDYDLANKQLATEQDLEELKSLLQKMDTNKPVLFGLPDDPNYAKYFYSTAWINRNGTVSLSINYKKSAIYSSNHNATAANALKAWDAILTKRTRDPQWRNTKAMEMQFHCHVNFASDKSPWNIEPHRTQTNYAIVVAHACNP